ncbi:MAG: GNAT family N-acetyltransferase [Candidatus Thermoplasmatota archaeon]|jgi:ribosomal-protein-alanine N-acetyltransferase|nr:GNAT family N-acetyltransferase [Candidatus Sysuiplasma jiujiangense]MBX8641169.1 GNAT family N-acetyltransferase [Candidatus Sysuiplasma jiujiangense]MCL4316830.1 GNAT family N-acetyltransferase [Candidatus Thermoplasmatota archaeon]MCL5253677.1 GNAT family N-acetyltransferase [Candidatus Thermoplasmatota archaeon]
MAEWVKPVTLKSRHLTVRPMNIDDSDALSRIIEVGDYALLRQGGPENNTAEAFRSYFQGIIGEPGRLEFVIIDNGTGKMAGHTGYLDIREHDRALEIGHTVLARQFRGGYVNPESKYLLLSHAFETLNAVRVQIKTDTRNVRSQKAIEKIGAVREGILRSHDITAYNVVRDVVMYSVISGEWPSVKQKLIERIEQTS